MLHIVIRHTGKFLEHAPLEDAYYLQGYCDLADALANRAVLYLTKENYLGGMRFARGWMYRGGTFVRVDKPFEADLIYNKDSTFTPDAGVHVLNHPDLDRLTNDKARTAALFPDLCPISILVEKPSDLQEAIATIPGHMIVLKPLKGYGGAGIYIGPKDRAAIDIFPCLAQEFIDTFAGIPGVIDAIHDFRFILMNGEIACSFCRTPRKGSGILLSNFALGGWLMPVPARMRPAGALELCERIDAELARFGLRIYTVDCARAQDGMWKLIEINSPPGQQNRLECGDDADKYYRLHVDLLLNAARAG